MAGASLFELMGYVASGVGAASGLIAALYGRVLKRRDDMRTTSYAEASPITDIGNGWYHVGITVSKKSGLPEKVTSISVPKGWNIAHHTVLTKMPDPPYSHELTDRKTINKDGVISVAIKPPAGKRIHGRELQVSLRVLLPQAARGGVLRFLPGGVGAQSARQVSIPVTIEDEIVLLPRIENSSPEGALRTTASPAGGR